MSLLPRAAARRTLALAAAVLVAGSALATPAFAEETDGPAVITGRVLFEGSPDAPPAAGTGVLLLPVSTGEVQAGVSTTTAADGSFTATVEPGVGYFVAATVEDGLHVPRDLGATGRFTPGTVVSADAGETLVLPSYVVPLGATISGHVVTDDGAPVPVSAYQGPLVGYTDSVTDGNGDYTVRGLDPDLGTSFTVAFGSDGDGGAQEWWRDSPTQDGAEPIVITSLDQAVTGIDADLRTPRANPLDAAPCLDRSTLTLAKATAAARAYLRSHPDLDALSTLTRADVKQYLARCA
ncbi:carboxypeptidase-like regulatory domain-containing protein [Rathayibacter sp. VKM Ac-2760]|uniref:carboxypeptidase-like regulatory domain-containing protein n=1 Tax=Rathayibacter sp. VKM Ac-2760 TaxID=2609253 RepID=UPI0013164ACE|nr:carboxypeptidase-like regulatory domain-containing protein [Rathayibacter sp. VKM Ac-2760]QHC60412.1 hypothetical protein GSU72_19035 [Rathayibacter sp. VKM Ac-2760]